MRSSRWRWQADEIFVKIDGERHYLWRATDHEGEVLESFATRTRASRLCTGTRLLRHVLESYAAPGRSAVVAF